jgi:hypothetical protein
MSFNHFNLHGNHWETAAEAVARRIRLRSGPASEEAEPEFPEAEISDAERRAAMARERMRRQGMR